jgi:hypothetical protein|tara:strand:+ start:8521 stop:9174 length:654 start_codon:yes stop_codon:yes gene_type:complete
MAQTWDLTAIRAKVRKLTGTPSTGQLSNSDLDNYIDNYYRNVLPLQTHATEFDKFDGSAGFTGTTTAGTGEYAFGADVFGIREPIIFDSENITLNHDFTNFIRKYPPSDTTQSKPQEAAIFERKLWLRPLPDNNSGSNYTFEAPKIDRPTSLSAVSDEPVDQLYGPAIAYGASVDIHMDRGEDEQAASRARVLEVYMSLIFRKDIASEIGRSATPNF